MVWLIADPRGVLSPSYRVFRIPREESNGFREEASLPRCLAPAAGFLAGQPIRNLAGNSGDERYLSQALGHS
jgi:hypothetical protein